MSTRQPFAPLAPISPNILTAKPPLLTIAAKLTRPDAPATTMAERVLDDNTQTSSGSVLSSLTGLDDDTDEFGRLLVQQAREDRDRQAQAQAQHGQPFRKARPTPRMGLTLENLERNNDMEGVIEAESPRKGGDGSVSSGSGSDRRARVREWGRKGRKNMGWLKRLAEPQEDVFATPRVAHAITDEDTMNWSEAVADIPLPSIEDSPLSQRSRTATPGSIKKENDSLERIQEWEMTDDDFTGSIIASTPAVWSRNTKLADIRQRELESIKEAAVATQRLDRIRDSVPEERTRPRSSSRKSINSQEGEAGDALERSWTHPAEQELPPKMVPLRRSTGSLRLSGAKVETSAASPVVVYKAPQTVSFVDQAIQGKGQTSPQRPNHKRQDSRDLLRRLARVTSSTPSPKPSSENTSRQLSSTDDVVISSPLVKAAANAASRSVVDGLTLGSKQGEDQDRAQSTIQDQPSWQTADEGLSTKPNGQSVSANGQPINGDVTEVSVLKTAKQPKTPLVTGGWIDTPAPAAKSDSHLPSPPKGDLPKLNSLERTPLEINTGLANTREQKSRLINTLDDKSTPLSASSHPSSALAALVNRAKSRKEHQPDDTIGESTIDSLEDLLSPRDDPSGTIELDEDTLLGLQLPTETPKTAAERQRLLEIQQLQSMNARLKAARASIRDASRGMRRVEERVDHADTSSERVSKHCDCEDHDALIHAGVLTSLLNDLKSLFWQKQTGKWWGLTSFGLACIIIWSWIASEAILWFVSITSASPI